MYPSHNLAKYATGKIWAKPDYKGVWKWECCKSLVKINDSELSHLAGLQTEVTL